MADTTAAAGLTPQQWDDKFFTEWLQNNPFKGYMGTDENSIIQIKEDLTKKKGDSLTYALVNKLTGAGVTGSSTLEGNEEAMDSRSFAVAINKRRNAVRVSEIEEQFSSISLRNAAKAVLKDWAYDADTDRIYDALSSINGVAYGTATEAQKDAWLDDNTDRVLFGAAQSNLSTTAPAGGATYDHSGSLANCDTTNDRLTPSALSLMKYMALNAAPKIRPIRTGGGNKRHFVAFAHPLAFRDLKTNTTLTQAQREVTLSNQNNKLFQGGDVEWDGIIAHECDGMPSVGAVGASSALVVPVYLCGAQAIAMAMGKRWTSKTEEFDYGDKHGVAIEIIDGLKKMLFGSGSADTDDLKQHGVVTGYFATTA